MRSPVNLRAKRSTHASYVPMALTADRWARGKAVTLLPDAFAVRIETSRTGTDLSATGVAWRGVAREESGFEEAKLVVLAAGAVETPRLWLNSGLPNPNGQVGRGLTNHYYDHVIGRLRTRTNSSKGPVTKEKVKPEKWDVAYVREHKDLIDSIRSGKPLNEGRQIAESLDMPA